MKILMSMHPALVEDDKYMPVSSEADENCAWRAASLGSYGSDNYWLLLKTLSCLYVWEEIQKTVAE